jgi:pSer/pThr/pTyr-binding forkhead associated (FHA) protein
VSLILEVKEGRLAGKQIAVLEGREVTVGRAPDRADFGVPHDNFMSSLHFAVECGRGGCRVKDRKSSNGTFLNGARVTEAALSDGDEIRSGGTVFAVRIVAEVPEPAPAKPVAAPPPPPPPAPNPVQAPAPEPPVVVAPASEPPVVVAPPPAPKAPEPVPEPPPPPEPVVAPAAVEPPAPPPPAPEQPAVAEKLAPARPAAPSAPPPGPALITIGGWSFSKVPKGWEGQGEFGIQRAEKDAFPSNVVAGEEMLGIATLQRFVEAQVSMLRKYLRDPQIEASLPPAIHGAEDTVALDIRYTTKDEQVICLRRIFARQAQRVGVLTLTTLEKDLEEIRPALDAILAGASFQPKD